MRLAVKQSLEVAGGEEAHFWTITPRNGQCGVLARTHSLKLSAEGARHVLTTAYKKVELDDLSGSPSPLPRLIVSSVTRYTNHLHSFLPFSTTPLS